MIIIVLFNYYSQNLNNNFEVQNFIDYFKKFNYEKNITS